MEHYDMLAKGRWKAPSLQKLQKAHSTFTTAQKRVVRRCVLDSVDSAIHDFLFKLQEQADFENRIQVLVDGNDVVKCSDGLHGEMFGEDGWYAKYSKDGEPPKTP